MILIVDSGSTKTDWCVVHDGKDIYHITTNGTNPFFQTEEIINHEIATHVFPALKDFNISKICFYGAGCAFQKQKELIQRILFNYFPVSISVFSDIMAAAHALCQHEAGIACILGTGSNTCQFNGHTITKQIPALGYILGDEGSGAFLGKHLVADALKNQLPAHLKQQFMDEYDLTQDILLQKVYREPFPNRYLAGFSPFILRNIQEPYIFNLVEQAFESFYKRNILQYDYNQLPVHFIGSIAWFFKDILIQTGNKWNVNIGNILKSPMSGLISYYKTSI